MKSTSNKYFQAVILAFLATAFFIGLIALIKYTLITVIGLYEPMLAWVQLVFSEENGSKNFFFEPIIVLKLLSVFVLFWFIFAVYTALSTVSACIFYKFCSRNYKTINHSLKNSLLKGIKWNYYRTLLIITPPILLILVGAIIFTFTILFFNIVMKIVGISITLSAFIISFVSFSIIFLFILSLLFSLWQMISTIFGIEIAVSEPKLSNKIIKTRAQKLIFAQKHNLFLALCYVIFVYNIIIQLKYAITTNLLTNPENSLLLNGIVIFNLLCFGLLEYLKASNYLDSLNESSRKIFKSPVKVVIPCKKPDNK